MKFSKKTLPNGLRVITVPMPDNPAVTVLIMVEAGSKYETTKNNGISHFLEHMVFKGTPKRPKASDISRELDSIGVDYNAFTGHEYTGYYAKAAARHLDTVLDIVSDLYLNPTFDAAEIEKEKGVVIEEIRMYNDMPQSKVQDAFMELLYGDQPAAWPVTGEESHVRSFTRDMLVDYRTQHYVSGATTIVVSGAVTEKEIIPKIEKLWSAVSAAPKGGKESIHEEQHEPRIKTVFKETDQTHMVIGFRTFDVKDPRIPVMSVLSTILGRGMSSRLFSKMRDEMGICYYVNAGHSPFTDHGFLSISAGLDNSRVEQGIRGILEECTRLKNEPVPELELTKAKEYIAGTTMLGLETSDARAEFCGHQEIMKREVLTPDERIARIRAVTAEDVQKLAGEIFTPANLNLALIGRTTDEKPLRDILAV